MNLRTLSLPTFLQMEPVGQCNLRCQMCPIQFRRDGPPYGPPAFMAFETFTRLLDQLPGLQELQLQGLGEPMMYPRFFDMVAYATARGIRVSTNSNLTLLNPQRAVRCVTCGLGDLHISIDGATPETYERIRVRAHLDRVLGNLELLLDAKQRLGSATPRLRLVVVAMRQNLHELPDLVRLAHRYTIDSIFVQHLCHDFGESSLPAHYRPMREFVDSQTLLDEDPARIAHYFGEARSVAEQLGVRLRLPPTRPRVHPAHYSRTTALRLALARSAHQLSGTCHAVLHGGHARPHSLRQYGGAGRRGELEQGGLPGVPRSALHRNAARGLSSVLGLFWHFLSVPLYAQITNGGRTEPALGRRFPCVSFLFLSW